MQMDIQFMTTRIIACRVILLSSFIATTSLLQAAEVRITVDTSTTVNTMRGGIGASWHAIEKPITTEYDTIFKLHQHGGSGWGGNPPAENEDAWRQLYDHASWLGMDFLRVELEQRMYEPKRKAFDWDNPEMRILYRILDWCQKNDADVFLTQMWSNVAWNTFDEFRKTPAGIVHSGPRSMDDFSEGLATCVEHLVKKKGYTCIKWLCITNEPSYGWSWWNRPPNVPMPLRPGLDAVRKALDKRGLNVALSAPDMVGVPTFDPTKIDFDDLVGAYDYHSYGIPFDWAGTQNSLAAQHARLTEWTKWTHARDKPFFLSELGAKIYDGNHPGPAQFQAAIHNAELVVRHLNAGVDGFNRWSFNNRGDLDGQFQMVNTWDPKAKKLLKHILPNANPYFVYGLLSRFTAKHSAVLSCQLEGGSVEKHSRVFAAALRSPGGDFTMAVINDAPQPWNITVQLDGLKQPIRLYRYEVSQKDADRTDLSIEPKADVELSATAANLSAPIAPMSLTIYSTYKLSHNEKGVIAEPPH